MRARARWLARVLMAAGPVSVATVRVTDGARTRLHPSHSRAAHRVAFGHSALARTRTWIADSVGRCRVPWTTRAAAARAPRPP